MSFVWFESGSSDRLSSITPNMLADINPVIGCIGDRHGLLVFQPGYAWTFQERLSILSALETLTAASVG